MHLVTSAVIRLIYELLDAHGDTAQLAQRHAHEPTWEAHLEYLRALRRTRRGTLASISGQATR
jgi:hypothetical protein